MNLGDKECYEPDELPTALSRDLDPKDTAKKDQPPNKPCNFILKKVVSWLTSFYEL